MDAKKPKLEACERVLIVEGYSDLLFYAEALEKGSRNYPGVFIKPFNGKSDLVAQLETFLSPALLAEKKAIGVIVDADETFSGTCESFGTVLNKITKQDVRHGQWTVGPPRIGLFVVSGDGSTGEAESLVWRAWANDPENAGPRRCVETYLACMDGQGHRAKSPDKGRIGALLSVLSDEDPRLGPGARDRVFDFSRPEFLPLIDFLRRL
ncbi:DUF3226 domain-containing protein [Polyangium sorediatum]|uniref:DUF4435 domain-containing protein n=1 Tax=Polyangium sorediatum TaxID=889274 RepID=A0ABT6P961_9BACT|nr:DUF3226 domain-containing protein [Polyangium sorediatum]MDI1437166.1 hypothetical protein [Polyangium sorediatum]